MIINRKKTAMLVLPVLFLAIISYVPNLNFGRTNIHAVSANEEEHVQIGFIEGVYEENGKQYLKFDDVKFLTGEEAVKAAKKDGNAILEDGKYYVLDDYYIVNENKTLKSYEISQNASLNLLGFMIDPGSDDISNKPVSFEKFKEIINKRGHNLCYIYTVNNVIVKVESQFIP